MRIAVVGTSGAGKTTFGAKLEKASGIPAIELDMINWRPGWFDRSGQDKAGFVADVAAAVAGDRWAIVGNYGAARPLVLKRATHVVWLDLPRPLVMRQVIGRSFARAFGGGEVFPGCREDVWRWFRKDHPIRVSWDSHARKRSEYGARFADPANSHLTVFRCQTRTDVDAALTQLVTLAKQAP
jgi:adenylate kinase family enzyme